MTDELSKNPIVKDEPEGHVKIEVKEHMLKMEIWIRKALPIKMKIDTDVPDKETIRGLFKTLLEHFEEDD